jgi:hypothetical protein
MSAVPTMLVRLHPHLKQEESQRLLQNPAFLRNVAVVCRDCYLTITSSLIKLQADRVTKGTRHQDFLGIAGLRPELTRLHGKFIGRSKKAMTEHPPRGAEPPSPCIQSQSISRAATKENLSKGKLSVIDQGEAEHESSEEHSNAEVPPSHKSIPKHRKAASQPRGNLIVPKIILPDPRLQTEDVTPVTPLEVGRYRSSRKCCPISLTSLSLTHSQTSKTSGKPRIKSTSADSYSNKFGKP